MIADAKSRFCPFSAIIVHRFDRFSRSREDSIVYKSLLRKECGIKVLSVTEKLEDDKFSIILESILEAMAEYYSLNLSDEVKKGMSEKARQGGLQTSPALGYRAENGRLIIIPEEAAYIKYAFDMAFCGAKASDIAAKLNALGAKSKRGNPITPRAVKYILQNSVYAGCLRWKTADGAILAHNCHEPIISEKMFNEIQVISSSELMKQEMKESAQPIARPQKHWLSGYLRCAECKRPLTLVLGRYFRCSGYLKGKCGTSQNIRADIIEKIVISEIRNPDALKSIQSIFFNRRENSIAIKYKNFIGEEK